MEVDTAHKAQQCFNWQESSGKGASDRVYLNGRFKDAIDDFKWLASEGANRATWIAEPMPDPPVHVGSSNAARADMGGAWLPDTLNLYITSLGPSLTPVRTTRKGGAAAAALLCLGRRGLPLVLEETSSSEVAALSPVPSLGLPPILW